MSIQTIDPRDMSAVDWTDQNALLLTKFGTIPKLAVESDWQDWAANLLNLPTIHGITLPNPYQFADWRRWAAAFNLEMNSVNL